MNIEIRSYLYRCVLSEKFMVLAICPILTFSGGTNLFHGKNLKVLVQEHELVQGH